MWVCAYTLCATAVLMVESGTSAAGSNVMDVVDAAGADVTLPSALVTSPPTTSIRTRLRSLSIMLRNVYGVV